MFFTLGSISFGGPAAHIAMMQEEVVTKRKWFGEERLPDLIGATNLIPGPPFGAGSKFSLLAQASSSVVPDEKVLSTESNPDSYRDELLIINLYSYRIGNVSGRRNSKIPHVQSRKTLAAG